MSGRTNPRPARGRRDAEITGTRLCGLEPEVALDRVEAFDVDIEPELRGRVLVRRGLAHERRRTGDRRERRLDQCRRLTRRALEGLEFRMHDVANLQDALAAG